jgi:putative DNA primase/helicase
MGNAMRFAEKFGNKVRYDQTSGKWMAWDGRRWDRTGGETQAQMYCRGVAIDLHQELGNCVDSDEKKKTFRHWQYTSSAAGVRNMLFLVRSEPGIAMTEDKLDAHPWLLNVMDGTIDLTTGEIKPHDPNDMITQLAPVYYRKDVEHPSIERWSKCLHTWHPNDDGMIEYLQKLMGYCLTGVITSRCLPIFWGTGKNGKNGFIDPFIEMLGDYAGVAARTLVEGAGREEHCTEVADLWKKRLVLASEPKKGSKLKVSLVKAMTGDKEMKARFMRQDFFEFMPTHKLIMLTQNLPAVEETTDAIWDRIHKIQWGVRISREEQNPNLNEDLKAEWTGILRWAIQGCLEWQKPPGILLPTKKIERDTSEYRNDQNPAKKFVDSMFVMGLGLFVSSAEVNRLLGSWISDGHDLLTKEELTAYLVDAGCIKNHLKKIGGMPIRGWLGVGIRNAGGE